MSDLTLSDGREITIDLSKMTLREYQELFNPKKPLSYENEILSKVTGLTVDEYLDLSFPESRKLWKIFKKKALDPLADPS
jgi:hypothetical protein